MYVWGYEPMDLCEECAKEEAEHLGMQPVKMIPSDMTDSMLKILNSTGRPPHVALTAFDPEGVNSLSSPLASTVPNMVDSNPWNRFLAERDQLEIRTESLRETLKSWEDSDDAPGCSRELLEQQLSAMETYLRVLEERRWQTGVAAVASA
jgi:hypothetical protein